MAEHQITKMDGARRQIDGAIECLFSGSDFVPVWTVSYAAFCVLKDLAKKTESETIKNFWQLAMSKVRPEKEKEFWTQFSEPANFLKHAERDPDGILISLNEEIVDFLLCWCCLSYVSHGNQPSDQMRVFLELFAGRYPYMQREEYWQWLEYRLDFRLNFEAKSRPEWIELGKLVLRITQLRAAADVSKIGHWHTD